MIEDPQSGSQGTVGSQGTSGEGGGAQGGATKNSTSGAGANGYKRITYTATKRVFITEYSHK